MRNTEQSTPVQYSKKLLTAMIRLWFAGAVFGMVFAAVQLVLSVLIPEGGLQMAVSADAVLNYIGIPMTGGTVGYLLKSAVENREKIQHSHFDSGYDPL